MIEFINNLLDENELIFLNKKMTNNLDDFPSKPNKLNQWYYKLVITPKEFEQNLRNYYENLKEYVNTDIFEIIDVNLSCATVDTNTSDKFHHDVCDKTIVTYLTDDFIGGEFEYFLNDKIETLKPYKNLSVIFNSKVKHKIMPVISGFRYSLVLFCKLKPTNKIKLF